MDASHAEKISTLAKSLYGNRLVASMDEATAMAESILNRTGTGENRTGQEFAKETNGPVGHHKKTNHPTTMTPPETKPSATQTNQLVGGDAQKLAALKRIVSEEDERIAKLRAELTSLKTGTNQSGQIVSDLDKEVQDLAAEIESAKDDIHHIREHIRDLEEIKHEIKDIEEAQDRMDTIEEEAEEIKEKQGPDVKFND